MYCRMCGKQIEGDGELCKECQTEALMFKKQDSSSNANKTRMYGFPMALSSAIVSVFDYFITLITFSAVGANAIGNQLFADSYYYTLQRILRYFRNLNSFFIAFIFMTSTACLVLGIISITKFFKIKKMGDCPKPVATLVLGILAVVLSASCLFTNLCTLIIYIF